LDPHSQAKIRGTMRLVTRVIDPARVAGLTESQLSRVVSDLRERKRSEATVRGHIRNLKTFLRWAHRRQLLDRVPMMPVMGRAVPSMKGRPITLEEFERMLESVPAVVGVEHAGPWRHLLRGLWLTGLRLGEALELDWVDDSRLAVELAGEYPFFRIQAQADKGRRFRLLPMAPEAGAFFLETPATSRRGKVFRPINPKDGFRPSLNWASKIITKIGREARVAVTEPRQRHKTATAGETSPPEPKWASAHDLRRAFGFRLSLRVRAPLLMQLMRHQSITTTLQFYVGHDATAAAQELWRETRDSTNTSANTGERFDRSQQSNGSETA
jgi:integrase